VAEIIRTADERRSENPVTRRRRPATLAGVFLLDVVGSLAGTPCLAGRSSSAFAAAVDGVRG
jgi:hypothetical protein